MSLRPVKTVSRRADWRARLPFWDRETFQAISVPDAAIGLALFREGDDAACVAGWTPRIVDDYGWVSFWRFQPALVLLSDDGTARILPDGDSAAVINVPQAQIAALPPGTYILSLAAAMPDGSVVDLGTERVSLEGGATPTVWHAPLTSDTGLPSDSGAPVNTVSPAPTPFFPGPPLP